MVPLFARVRNNIAPPPGLRIIQETERCISTAVGSFPNFDGEGRSLPRRPIPWFNGFLGESVWVPARPNWDKPVGLQRGIEDGIERGSVPSSSSQNGELCRETPDQLNCCLLSCGQSERQGRGRLIATK